MCTSAQFAGIWKKKMSFMNIISLKSNKIVLDKC